MNKPLLLAFIIFISGIVFASLVPVPFITIITASFLLIIFIFISSRKSERLFFIAAAILIFILGSASYINYNTLPLDHISRLPGERYYIKGRIVSSPKYTWGRWNKRRASFDIRVSGYKCEERWLAAEGLSKLKIRDSRRDYLYGDEIVVYGYLKTPDKPAEHGEFDYAAYLSRYNIYSIIETRSDNEVITLTSSKRTSGKRLIFRLREWAKAMIESYLPAQAGTVLNAMLIGDRSGISADLRERFIETGTAHILSVSGLHVGLISSIIFFLLRLVRIPRKASGVIVILFLSAYVIFSGARTPIARAAIMITVFFISYLLERRFDIYSAFSAAGLIILAFNPMEAFNAGFALSFVCVFSICYLAPRLNVFLISALRIDKTKSSIYKNKIVRVIWGLVLGSAAVCIGVAPLTAFYFNIFSPITLAANIIIIPLLWVTLFLGIFFLLSAALFPQAASFLSYPLHATLALVIRAIYYLSGIKVGHFYIDNMPLSYIIIYYICILTITERKMLTSKARSFKDDILIKFKKV